MKPSLLSRLALLSAAIFFSAFCIAGELPKSIDFFTQKGIPGKFLKCYDPGYVVIKLDSGGMIDTKYSGIDFETIYMWEPNQGWRWASRVPLLERLLRVRCSWREPYRCIDPPASDLRHARCPPRR